MELKAARAIARKVGATIEERPIQVSPEIPSTHSEYIVRLGVCRIGGNGTREEIKRTFLTPEEAAKEALLETARACGELREHAKRAYVESDLL